MSLLMEWTIPLAVIPDNKFRSRDPKFSDQKNKYGKRHQNKKSKPRNKFSASEFTYDPIAKTCIYPEEKNMGFLQETKNKNHKIYFEGKLTDCRHCNSKHRCMRNPDSAGTLERLRRSLSTSSLRSGRTRLGHGRQVSFIIGKKVSSQFTDWMKPRVDSAEGKLIYSHRMSVVDRLLLLHNLHFRHPWRSTRFW